MIIQELINLITKAQIDEDLLNTLEKHIQNNRDEISLFAKKLTLAEEKVAAIQHELNQAFQYAALENKLQNDSQEYEKLKTAVDDLTSQVSLLEEKRPFINQLADKIAALKTLIPEYENLSTLEKKIFIRQQEISQQELSLQKIKTELSAKQTELEKKNKTIEELREKLDKNESNTSALKARNKERETILDGK